MNEKETFEIFSQIMQGKLSDNEISLLLKTLAEKGETPEEITGAAKALQQAMVSIKPNVSSLLDTCGTGGDNSQTFNISTAAAIVACAAGCKVAKHGNRAASSNSGSADVLEELGVNINLAPERIAVVIEKIGIGFMFACSHHPAMKYAAVARKNLGIRTIFNIVGPLTNPANASIRLVGVSGKNLCEKMIKALSDLNVARAMVVHGCGLDELGLCKENIIYELKNGKINNYTLDAATLGLNYCDLQSLKVASTKESAEVINGIFSCKIKDCRRDIVVLNAAAAVYLYGKADSIADAVPLAENALDSGLASSKLAQLIKETNRV